jgi:hypothetical protein
VADILIRDVPENVIASIDARAARLGLSRSEYIRRQWAQEATRADMLVTVDHLREFAGTFSDLDDPDVAAQAWS